jgi:hypothetical protein
MPAHVTGAEMSRNRWYFGFAALVVTMMMLLGCGARGASAPEQAAMTQSDGASERKQSSEEAPAPAAGRGAAQDALQAGIAITRMVIKTGDLSVRVKDVDAAFARAMQLTEAGGGYVQSSTQSVEGGNRADLTLRVPPDRFLPLIASLEALGTQESKSLGGQDVTEEYYDLDAELQNKVQVRGRLFQLLERASKVSDAIAVEEQLDRVGADVNRIKGRMKYLQTMVGLATVNLSIYSESRPAAEEFINWSLVGHGFVVAARTLVRALFFILQALVVLIPLGALGGAIAWGVVTVVRTRKKRRAP